MSEPTSEIQQHLRGASDAVLLLTSEVEQLERHKRGVRPNDPRFETLARAVRDAAEALAAFAREEEVWAASTETTALPLKSISDSATPASLASILNRWRDVERRLNDAPAGTPEAAKLFEEFERVRDEYMAAFQRREDHRLDESE